MSHDALLPEDFAGYDEAQADHEAAQADALNDEAFLSLPQVRVLATDELIRALIDVTTPLPASMSTCLELQTLLLQLRIVRRATDRVSA